MDAIALTSSVSTNEPAPTTAPSVVSIGNSGDGFDALVDTADAPLGATVSSTVQAGSDSGWKQLETLLVQQMLQSVMASEDGGFFGEGLGSDLYQSFMVEQFAARLSEGLDLGIASNLDGRYGSGDST